MKRIFPLSFLADNKSILPLIAVCAVYIAVAVAARLLLLYLNAKGLFPGIVSAAVVMYCLMGIIAAVLAKMKRL